MSSAILRENQSLGIQRPVRCRRFEDDKGIPAGLRRIRTQPDFDFPWDEHAQKRKGHILLV